MQLYELSGAACCMYKRPCVCAGTVTLSTTHAIAISWCTPHMPLLSPSVRRRCHCYLLVYAAHAIAISWCTPHLPLLSPGVRRTCHCYLLVYAAHAIAISWCITCMPLLSPGVWHTCHCHLQVFATPLPSLGVRRTCHCHRLVYNAHAIAISRCTAHMPLPSPSVSHTIAISMLLNAINCYLMLPIIMPYPITSWWVI